MSRRSRLRATWLAAGALAVSPLPWAHSVFDLDEWMDRIDDGNQDLQRSIAARDRDAALERARELEELYRLMEKFFVDHGGSDNAVRISREGRAQAAAAVRHLSSGQFNAAKARALEIAHGCRGCHVEYKPL
jgi:hypothetical protein